MINHTSTKRSCFLATRKHNCCDVQNYGIQVKKYYCHFFSIPLKCVFPMNKMTIDEFIENNIITDIWSVVNNQYQDKHQYVCFRYRMAATLQHVEKIYCLCIDDFGCTYSSINDDTINTLFDKKSLKPLYTKYKIKDLLQQVHKKYPIFGVYEK